MNQLKIRINQNIKRKKLKEEGKSFNMNNATKTFKKLIEKQMKEEKAKNQRMLKNKKDKFFNLLNNIFFKADIKERYYDYFFHEIKYLINENQNMVELYGINGKKKAMKRSKENMRFNKNLLFNPLKNGHQISKKYTPNNLKDKYDKKLLFPCILKKNNSYVKKNNPSLRDLLIDKTQDNNFKNKKENNSYINYNLLANRGSIKKGKEDNTLNQNNLNTEIQVLNNSKSNGSYNITSTNECSNQNKSLDLFLKKKNNKKFGLRNKNKSSVYLKKGKYLSTLNNLNHFMVSCKNNFEKYFDSNDYGYNIFNNKYNYISNNFFK